MGVDSGETAATITTGEVGVLHGSKSYVMQDHDGQVVEPYSISAGLDYPGIGPLHAHLHASQRGRFVHATDQQALDAAFLLTELEGIVITSYSIHYTKLYEASCLCRPRSQQPVRDRTGI